MNINQTIGENAAALRKVMDYSLQEVADGLGISRSTAGALELGSHTISAATLMNLCGFYGVHTSTFTTPGRVAEAALGTRSMLLEALKRDASSTPSTTLPANVAGTPNDVFLSVTEGA